MKSAANKLAEEKSARHLPPTIFLVICTVGTAGQAVNLSLSFRDVEDLLTERGVIVSYEAIRKWCKKFGSEDARRLKCSRLVIPALAKTWEGMV